MSPLRRLKRRERIAVATVAGLVLGFGMFASLLAILAFSEGRGAKKESASNTKNIESLTLENRALILKNQTITQAAQDAYCKLKYYDLATGIPALRARENRTSQEFNKARAEILRKALDAVSSIPSSHECIPSKYKTPTPPRPLRFLENELLVEPIEHKPPVTITPAPKTTVIVRKTPVIHKVHQHTKSPAPKPAAPAPAPPPVPTVPPVVVPAEEPPKNKGPEKKVERENEQGQNETCVEALVAKACVKVPLLKGASKPRTSNGKGKGKGK